ncbi:MAG: hypothetical protein E6G83_00010 [Alphaproteobacteria bacterium]|nr:MAG: hypothetical protein E6G83_00010 [Alphaproteobacteria bacterium]
MAVSERTEIVAVETATSFLQWTPVIAGALVASAISLVLIAFGSAIGLSILSSSPTWRDASPALAVLSGLFLLLTAIASFGLGGYLAGRLRERWHQSAHNDVVEFRDGTHGVVAWAIAVVITGLIAAASAAVIASREVQPATSPIATTSVAPEDRTYLVRLVATRTGISQPDAERRVDDAIAGATTAVRKARRGAVILAFATAVSLLVGAATAWYASCVGGRHRDGVAPSLSWRLPQRA